MRLLLDTNILIKMLDDGARLSAAHRLLIAQPDVLLFATVVSLWEMGIKTRSGKLHFERDLTVMERVLSTRGVTFLPLTAHHAMADPNLGATVRDPFDRMIVAVAELEHLSLLTTDATLLDHRLAWHP